MPRIVQVLLASASLVAWIGVPPASAQSALWLCEQPDGSSVFSDRVLGPDCREVDALPPLQRGPSGSESRSEAKPEPPAGTKTDSKESGDPERRLTEKQAEPPTPHGSRREPPDSVIRVRVVDAVPSFNGVLGIAHYRATLEVENEDGVWTAEKVCLDVRFRDRSAIFVDVHQVGCLEELKPLTQREFTVTYTGMMPPRVFPIKAEAVVEFVKWKK